MLSKVFKFTHLGGTIASFTFSCIGMLESHSAFYVGIRMLLLSALCKLDFSTLHSSPDKEEETIDAVTKPTDFKTVTG